MTIDPNSLNTVPLFQSLGSGDAAAFIATGRIEELGPHRNVITEGGTDRALFVIIQGSAAVMKQLDDGRQELLMVLTAGDCCGELALLSAVTRSASIVTLEPTQMWMIDGSAFDQFVAGHPLAGMQLYQGLATTISARLRRMTERLAQCLANGAEIRHGVAQVQSDMATLMAKQVRTPVAVLKGTADLLMQADLSPDRRERFLQTMGEQAAHLTQLLTDMHQLAALQDHTTSLAKEPIPLATLVEAIVKGLESSLTQRQLRLTVQIPPDVPPVRVHREKMAKALAHLLANGVRYSRPGGELELRARRWDGGPTMPAMVEIAVRDTGPGMPPTVQQALCAEGSAFVCPSDTTEAMGIGLALVRCIVMAHGGILWVEATPKEGTTVFFTVPV